MEIKLFLNSKNWAKFEDGDPLVIKGDNVPRVGEIIDVGLDFGEDPSTFIVIDILWKNENSNLVPHLECHQWLDGDRQLELEERGWALPSYKKMI